MYATSVSSPPRLEVIVCIITVLVWAAAPATAWGASHGKPDHAADPQHPAHSQEPGPPDHAQGSAEQADEPQEPGPPDHAQGSAEQGDEPQEPGPPDHAQGSAEQTDEPQEPAAGADARSDRSRQNDPPRREPRAEPVRDRGEATATDTAAEQHAVQAESEADPATTAAPNRGSVKVRTVGAEAFPPRNEPHVGCEFWFHFHGFEADERTFSLSAWPPTGSRQQVFVSEAALADARGADHSGISPPDPDDGLTLDDLDLAPDWPGSHEAHAQQGWHIRLDVDGPKHKVFWVDCPTDVPAEDDDVAVEDDDVAVEDDDVAVEDEAFGVGGADIDDEVAVLGLIIEADEDVQVVGRAADERAELPVTGAHLLWLVAIALLMVGSGARLLRST